jgi:hypothetical protein
VTSPRTKAHRRNRAIARNAGGPASANLTVHAFDAIVVLPVSMIDAVEAAIGEIKSSRADRAPTTGDESRAWRDEGRRF